MSVIGTLEILCVAVVTAVLAGLVLAPPARAAVDTDLTNFDTAGNQVPKGTVTLTAGHERAPVPAEVTTDLVRMAVMSASSTHSGSDAAWANDGGTDSEVWLNGVGGWNDDTPGDFPDTLTATWDAPVRLGRVRVLTLDSKKSPAARTGLRDFDVEALVDGDWRTVATVRGNAAGTVDRSFDPVTASALRIIARDANDHQYSRVIELEGYPGTS